MQIICAHLYIAEHHLFKNILSLGMLHMHEEPLIQTIQLG